MRTHSRGVAILLALLPLAACVPTKPDDPEPVPLGIALERFMDPASGVAEAQALYDAMDAALRDGGTSEAVLALVREVYDDHIRSEDDALALRLASERAAGMEFGDVGVFGSESCDELAVVFVNGAGIPFYYYVYLLGELRKNVHARFPDAVVTGVYNVSATDQDRAVFGSVVCPLSVWGAETVCELGGTAIDLFGASVQWLDQWAGYAFWSHDEPQRLLDHVARHLRDGRRVVLVPHSQGNLLVRDALDMAPFDTRRVAAVLTGSPISRYQIPLEEVRRVDICGDIVTQFAAEGQETCVQTAKCAPGDLSIACHQPDEYLKDAPVVALMNEIDDLRGNISTAPELVAFDAQIDQRSPFRDRIRVTGSASGCLSTTASVTVEIRVASLGSADPSPQWLGPFLVSPGHLDFDVASDAIRSCTDYEAIATLSTSEGEADVAQVVVGGTPIGGGGSRDRVTLTNVRNGGGLFLTGGPITYTSSSGTAGVPSALTLLDENNEASNALGFRRLWKHGRVDDVESFHVACGSDGIEVTFASDGRQKVRIINQDDNIMNATVRGTIRWRLVDGIERDMVYVTFEPDPDERWAEKAATGPFAYEVIPGGDIAVLLRI